MESKRIERGTTMGEKEHTPGVEFTAEQYITRCDHDDELATKVVEAVAAVEGVDPMEIGPLNDAVDPDCLSRLFPPRSEEGQGYVAFTFSGHAVTVDSEGTIVVWQGEEPNWQLV